MKPKRVHPKAKPGCTGCEKSVSGVCPAHASVDVEGHERRCTGTTEKGVQCRRWALEGKDTCMVHQTDEAKRQRAREIPRDRSLETQGRKAANEHLHEMERLTGARRTDVDAIDEIAQLADEVIILKDVLREHMRAAFGKGNDQALEEKTLARYVASIDRASKVLEVLSKQGQAERELRMREELVGVVTGLFNTILASFIAPELQAAAQAALGQAVGSLEAPRAITVGSA